MVVTDRSITYQQEPKVKLPHERTLGGFSVQQQSHIQEDKRS